VAAVAQLLLSEHSLDSQQDTRRLDQAFYPMNGDNSVTCFLFVLADVVV
jgi:hypothetical protein